MGIEKFHTWLRNKYYNSIIEYTTTSYTHVYIDLNFILHRLITYITTEDELIYRTCEMITHLVDINKPTKTLTLVADGTASYAKIMLQKRRRMQTALSITKDGRFPERLKYINPLHLTTGTEFMNKFNKSIHEYITKKIHEETDNIFKNIDIQLNLADETGEAEFKICQYINKNTNNIFDTHLILSNDADIVLIAMSLINIMNIFVVIQQSHNIDNYIISIDRLSDQYFEEYGYNILKKLDFVFISLLNGNDYFPKLKYTNFTKLWEVYKIAVPKNQSIVNRERKLNYHILIHFLSSFVCHIPKQFRLIRMNEIDDANIHKYLYGLQWCLSLYTTGNYLSYDYLFDDVSIHPAAINYYLQMRKIMDIPTIKMVNTPIQMEIYTIIVLPYIAKSLIPQKYHTLLDNELKYLYDEEVCRLCKKYRKHYNCQEENCKYPIKDYIAHRKMHNVPDAKKYIDDIVKIISVKYIQ